jgi:hypothetical protein
MLRFPPSKRVFKAKALGVLPIHPGAFAMCAMLLYLENPDSIGAQAEADTCTLLN